RAAGSAGEARHDGGALPRPLLGTAAGVGALALARPVAVDRPGGEAASMAVKPWVSITCW
ncbi:hypothetical protein ABZ805_28765, partial [Saccharopolyspora sp. NPDC047091]|uniref:hypothetical protein n=1 Tax=Saccharopolyspora sp. NPDC047091 TaxID=3155924 RepID=UPI0033F131BA